MIRCLVVVGLLLGMASSVFASTVILWSQSSTAPSSSFAQVTYDPTPLYAVLQVGRGVLKAKVLANLTVGTPVPVLIRVAASAVPACDFSQVTYDPTPLYAVFCVVRGRDLPRIGGVLIGSSGPFPSNRVIDGINNPKVY